MSEDKKVFVRIGGFTDVGPKRADNQDAIMANGVIGVGMQAWIALEGLVDGKMSLAVVDGMGGYAGGADAAAMGAAYLASRHIPNNGENADSMFERLDVGISAAGSAWATPKMGATAAMLTLDGCKARFANVGDCRVYRVAGDCVEVMTVDDRFRNSNHIVTQSLGQVRKLDVHFREEELTVGKTRFILCSDGVWGTLNDVAVQDLFTREEPPAELLPEIRKKLYSRYANDNISVVMVDVEVEQA